MQFYYLFIGYKLRVPTKIRTIFELRERIVNHKDRNFIENKFYRIPLPVRLLYKKNMRNFTVLCPENSKRNPPHLKGSYHHLIDYGSFYQMILPLPPDRWRYNNIVHPVGRAYWYSKKTGI